MPERRTAGARSSPRRLSRNGVERVFCVPGESYLALLDALYDTPIAVTVCRQEGGAAMAAEAWGKLTGRPGIVMVTRGPGATNASAGLHVGRQDSTPMILLRRPGRRARMRGREAFQEIDFRRMFGEVAKWVEEIDRADRMPEFVSRAFHEATSGRPGPVVLSLPEDMLRETTDAAERRRPGFRSRPIPASTQMAQLQKMLWAAKRPFVILGGSRWSEAAVAGMRRFAERFDLPVGCSFRRQMLFDHDHPNYAGDVGIGINPALAARVREADVLLLVGGRMSEMPSSGYTLIDIPEPRQALVHVHPGAEELGRLYRPTLAINASPTAFVAALEGLQPPHRDRLERRGPAPRTQSYRRLVGAGRRIPARCSSPRSSPGSASACPTTRSSPTAPATTPAGCTASSASAATARSSRRPPARWATACRRRSPPS